MKKLYYNLIGNRIVYLDYYIDNKRVELPHSVFSDYCFECAINEWLEENNITDTDIEVCPAPHNPNEKLRLLVRNYKYVVCFILSLDNQIVDQTFMTDAPSVDDAINDYCYKYGLERELIEVQETTEDILNLDDYIASLS